MNFLKRFFTPKTTVHDGFQSDSIRFGRYSDSYKKPVQYNHWEQALTAFESGDYVASYAHFFQYLSEPSVGNVEVVTEPTGLRFSLCQGSRVVQGFADARQFKAEARIVQAKDLSVAVMRRLIEGNYSLNYCRYGLDEADNLVIKFDSSALDASPYKLYFALKELAIHADKQDDILLDEFGDMLQPVDLSTQMPLPEAEKAIKFAFLQEKTQETLAHIEKSSLDYTMYSSGLAYQLLSTAYKIDFLLAPEGFTMHTVEKMHRYFFTIQPAKTPAQKNTFLLDGIKAIAGRSKELVYNELYQTRSTFGVVSPCGLDTIQAAIDGELGNMDWFEANGHLVEALAVPTYIVGNLAFNYALPAPVRDFIILYYNIFESRYFTALGLASYQSSNGLFDKNAIKKAIAQLAEKHQANHPTLVFDDRKLDFSAPHLLAKTYLWALRHTDFTSVQPAVL